MFNKRKKYGPNQNVFTEIFEKIYSKLECNIIYVFLCGGDCKEEYNPPQIRNDIKKEIEKISEGKIKILYPEELFFEDDKKTLSEYFRNKDLLELETILANNSNVVCIICESIGSATELGAFTNYKEIDQNELLDKLVAVTYKKYENEKPSFISEGPIKRLTYTKKMASQHKIYEYLDETDPKEYSKNKKKLAQELIDEFKKICKKNKKNTQNRLFLQENASIKNFIGLAYLILLFIYFYDGISSAELKPLFSKEFSNLKIGTNSEIEFFYPLAIRFLLNNQKYIEQNKIISKFVLTKKGFTYIKNMLLNHLNIDIDDLDYIRMRIMYNQVYTKKEK